MVINTKLFICVDTSVVVLVLYLVKNSQIFQDAREKDTQEKGV